ncbi:uncharacterized protein F4822DRAFT_409313 [Hypoxylon trugodes]|uniref:uncharacterized protein n=1 Tax=Hypoxylon trugodes TaxID=326681 RepID=UPI0021955E5B|nr:uncharacterized protein F4822DRAFT_409313 [Hypoxylon trugodes]KAI1386217.1 hypothetical protein F4822DRAFT_409313 [Hypoxylon trugodes]
MDRGDSVILDALQGILPEQTIELLRAHIQDPQSLLPALYQQTASFASKITAFLSPLLAPLFARLLQALHDSPDLVILGVVLAAIVLALQIVSWIHRTMMYVTRLAFRLLGWALVFALVAVVWRRGPEATVRDLVVVVSKIAGYVAVVKDIWWVEYQKFEAQTRQGGTMGGAAGAGVNAGGQRMPSSGFRSRNSGW